MSGLLGHRGLLLQSMLGTGYDAEVMADSPVAYWKLDEDSGGDGTSIADSSGNGHHLGIYFSSGNATVSDVSVLPTPGLAGIGRSIDQTLSLTGDGTVEVRDSAPAVALRLRQAAASWEFWWSRRRTNYEWLIFNGSGSGSSTCYYEIRQSNNGAGFEIKHTGAIPTFTIPAHGITDPDPHHLVFTLNADRNLLQFYRDGAFVWSGSANFHGAGSGESLFLGRRGDRSERTALNNVAIYDKELSPARIAAHYAARNLL